MVYTVGMTGGIGCGKSTATRLFAGHGVEIIDTDQIAHTLTAAGGAAIGPIRASFGDRYVAPDGSLDRAQMRQLVFADAAAKHSLEGILHPMIRTAVENRLRACKSPYAILVVPLLLETQGYNDLVQRILVVDCAEQTQVRRTMVRSGLSEPEVRAIMATQVSRSTRLKLADDVLENENGQEALENSVEQLHQRYLMLAGNAPEHS
jgi:dephospho-CoA kinase